MLQTEARCSLEQRTVQVSCVWRVRFNDSGGHPCKLTGEALTHAARCLNWDSRAPHVPTGARSRLGPGLARRRLRVSRGPIAAPLQPAARLRPVRYRARRYAVQRCRLPCACACAPSGRSACDPALPGERVRSSARSARVNASRSAHRFGARPGSPALRSSPSSRRAPVSRRYPLGLTQQGRSLARA